MDITKIHSTNLIRNERHRINKEFSIYCILIVERERNTKRTMSQVTTVDNFIGGHFVPPTGEQYISVLNPAVTPDDSTAVIGNCAVSTEQDVNMAVEAAKKALPGWSKMTIKARAAIMMKFHSIIQRESEALAQLIVMENGKNMTEALADGTSQKWGLRNEAENMGVKIMCNALFIFLYS